MTDNDKNLLITFISDKLVPVFVDGELKSYQIEMVEQVRLLINIFDFAETTRRGGIGIIL